MCKSSRAAEIHGVKSIALFKSLELDLKMSPPAEPGTQREKLHIVDEDCSFTQPASVAWTSNILDRQTGMGAGYTGLSCDSFDAVRLRVLQATQHTQILSSLLHPSDPEGRCLVLSHLHHLLHIWQKFQLTNCGRQIDKTPTHAVSTAPYLFAHRWLAVQSLRRHWSSIYWPMSSTNTKLGTLLQ